MGYILSILNEIAEESSTNAKMVILGKYKEDELLKDILYAGTSKRVKYYIKQIPEYNINVGTLISIEDALVELKKFSTRELTGNDAINHLTFILSSLDESDAIVIERIIKKKLNIGMGRTNINKVIGKGFLEKTAYQGAQSFSPEKIKKLINKAIQLNQPVYSNVKMDGRYANAIIRGGEIEIESRQGEPNLFTGAKFKKELVNMDGWVFNGEILLDPKKFNRYESNGIIASIVDIQKKIGDRSEKETERHISKLESKHNVIFNEVLESIQYIVWDVITVDEYFNKKSTTPYNKRFDKVLELTKGLEMVKPVEYKLVYSYKEVMEHFQEMLNRGEEGTVVKAYNGEWKDGKGPHQIKIKLELTIDLKVVGFNYGTGKNIDIISSLNCESECGRVKTKPTGIKEVEMERITNEQEKLLGTIVEVKCSGLSQNSDGEYSLMHPVLKRFRTDEKVIGDTLEEIIENENMIKGLI